MNFTPPSKRPWRWWLAFGGFWTVLGLSFASQFYVSSITLGRPVTWGFAVNHALFDWYVFAVLSLPAIGLSRRFRLARGEWPASVGAHLLASAAFSLLYMILRAWVAQVQGWFAGIPIGFGEAFHPLLIKTFHFSLLIYWVIVSVTHAFDYSRQAHDRELRTAELESRLTQARLQALQMQLNPHFLFNTLHAISALMHKDVDAADRMIIRLGELLRYALESTDAQEVSLAQELAFLDLYLEIEQTRFGSRLNIRKEIDPETLAARVPNLILQPLLENAIQHGVEPHARPGQILLSATHQNGALLLEVRDNGAGLPSGETLKEGVGVSNTRARLQQLYGENHAFELNNAAEGGFSVKVRIPFRAALQNIELE